jgi:hypothetical protein
MTDWFVYRCEECHQTLYVNTKAEDWEPRCGHVVRLVGLADERQVCDVLKGADR